MELNKVLEGFTVNNTLVIKAQVQVIRCVSCNRQRGCLASASYWHDCPGSALLTCQGRWQHTPDHFS